MKLQDQRYVTNMVVNKESYIIYSFYNENTTLEKDKNAEETFIYKPEKK